MPLSPMPLAPPVVVKRRRRVAPKYRDDPPASPPVPVVTAPPVVIPPPVVIAPAAPPPPEAPARRFIPSKLDALRDVLGVLPDWQVARRVDMTTVAVREYRRRHGIARVEPAVPAAPAATVAPAAFAAPEPARVVPTPSARVAAITHAYDVMAVRTDTPTRFIGVGPDISGALANAVAALAARDDGPWRVLSITDLHVVALVAPGADTTPVVSAPAAAGPAAVRTGADLRVYRVGAGLTQHLLGVRLGLRQSEVSKLEMAPTAALPPEIVEQLRKLGVGI